MKVFLSLFLFFAGFPLFGQPVWGSIDSPSGVSWRKASAGLVSDEDAERDRFYAALPPDTILCLWGCGGGGIVAAETGKKSGVLYSMSTNTTNPEPFYAKDLADYQKYQIRVLVRLFGWRWFFHKEKQRSILFPPADDEQYIRYQYRAADFIELDNVEIPDTEIFDDYLNGDQSYPRLYELEGVQTAEQNLRQFPPFFVEYTLAIVQEALKPVPGEKINEPSVLIGQLLALSPFQRVEVLGRVLEKNPGFYWKPISK